MRVALRLIVILLLAALPGAAGEPVVYRVAFPAPEHHYAQVEVTFPEVPAGPLEARMSRSSPGRYALHEYAKNVFDLRAYDGRNRELAPTRPDPSQWNVEGHDGTVRLSYKVYGDHVDGTYLAIDATHAHMNMPATLMWARGLESRPARITFVPPPDSAWVPATQLFPTDDRWTFTAPNLQYLMDSPAELSAQSLRSFKVRNPDGREQTIVTAVHHDAGDAEVDEYAAGVERIVREQGAIFGEYPEFDAGTYTFLADYVPWGGGDGMEHRNSTVVAAPVSLRTPQTARRVLGTVSHEFFHAWNVERIRPRTLEPFSFEAANISGELWLAEGFTQYYGSLVMIRAGFTSMEQGIAALGDTADSIVNGAARRFRSAVEMSQMAPFTDAARSVDRTNFSTTFISYYTYGAAVALALDLSLRDRSNGTIGLDDYMRAMWRVHGKPGGPEPGLVARPYTLQDARDRLAEVSGDRRFADEFFDKYIEGREVADYARLLARAGVHFRRRNPGRAWIGDVILDDDGSITNLVEWGSPIFEAGLNQGDTILAVGGAPLGGGTSLVSALASRKPGETLIVGYRRRGGATGTATVRIAEDPTLEAVIVEAAGGSATPAQRAFRQSWLGSKLALD
ncbi:MAG TPA: PDZ domain-containing protein [Vicinamibacterales bacterium]|nr:PDZ domain-containing protein [Vicinamibacterales bacterium]